MNEENIIIAYKLNADGIKALENVKNKTKEPFEIMITKDSKDIFPLPPVFMAFVNLENESTEEDKKHILKNVSEMAEYLNSIVVDEKTFKDEEKLIKLIDKSYEECYKQTEWDKLEDDYNKLMQKIKIYQKYHSLEKDDYTFSEQDLVQFFEDEWLQVKYYIKSSIKSEILYNKLLDYIDFQHKNISPISYNTINESILNLSLDYNVLFANPICYENENEQQESPRMLEIKQLAKLCDILADEIYIGKYDKSVGRTRIELPIRRGNDKHITDDHLIACRISQYGVFYNFMQYIKEIIKMYLQKTRNDIDEKNLFMYKFDDELWEEIRTFIKNFAELPLWKNRERAKDVFFGTSPIETWKEIFETRKTKDGVQVLENVIDITKMISK